MKVGSLVVCISDKWVNHSGHDVVFPVKDNIYTVRDIQGDSAIVFEEIINRKYFYEIGHLEPHFNKIYFREVQPPMTSEEITALLQPTPQPA